MSLPNSVKTHILEPVYFTQNRVEFRLPANKVMLSNLRLADLGLQTNADQGASLFYPVSIGAYALIKNIFLYNDNVVISQLHNANQYLAFNNLRRTNANSVNMSQPMNKTGVGYDFNSDNGKIQFHSVGEPTIGPYASSVNMDGSLLDLRPCLPFLQATPYLLGQHLQKLRIVIELDPTAPMGGVTINPLDVYDTKNGALSYPIQSVSAATPGILTVARLHRTPTKGQCMKIVNVKSKFGKLAKLLNNTTFVLGSDGSVPVGAGANTDTLLITTPVDTSSVKFNGVDDTVISGELRVVAAASITNSGTEAGSEATPLILNGSGFDGTFAVGDFLTITQNDTDTFGKTVVVKEVTDTVMKVVGLDRSVDGPLGLGVVMKTNINKAANTTIKCANPVNMKQDTQVKLSGFASNTKKNNATDATATNLNNTFDLSSVSGSQININHSMNAIDGILLPVNSSIISQVATTTSIIDRPTLLIDEVISNDMTKFKNIPIQYVNYDREVVSIAADAVSATPRLRAYDGKMVNRLMYLNETTSNLAFGTLRSAPMFREEIQFTLNGIKYLPFNGQTNSAEKMAMLTDSWGSLNIPTGSNQFLVSPNRAQLYDTKSNENTLNAQIVRTSSYGGLPIQRVVSELLLDYSRSIYPATPANNGNDTLNSLSKRTFNLIFYGEVVRTLKANNNSVEVIG